MPETQSKDYGLLIAKKAERLVSALYLVTDLLDTNEPLKISLRKSAVELLSSMNTLVQPEVKDRIIEYKMSLKSVTEILSFIYVAKASGNISEMNAGLLIDGFRSLQLVLEKKQPILTRDMLMVEREEELHKEIIFTPALTSTSYDVITPLSMRREDNENKSVAHIGQKENIKDIIHTEEYKRQVTHTVHTPSVARHNVKDEKSSNLKDTTNTSRSISSFTTSFQNKKQSRRDQILALFVKGVDISIKDITSRIKGCSEKTIQRELNNLVSDRVVSRIGEKRWSRYVLR